jgi:hypothetical protein
MNLAPSASDDIAPARAASPSMAIGTTTQAPA